jgi:hypothetical protein
MPVGGENRRSDSGLDDAVLFGSCCWLGLLGPATVGPAMLIMGLDPQELLVVDHSSPGQPLFQYQCSPMSVSVSCRCKNMFVIVCASCWPHLTDPSLR